MQKESILFFSFSNESIFAKPEIRILSVTHKFENILNRWVRFWCLSPTHIPPLYQCNYMITRRIVAEEFNGVILHPSHLHDVSFTSNSYKPYNDGLEG